MPLQNRIPVTVYLYIYYYYSNYIYIYKYNNNILHIYIHIHELKLNMMMPALCPASTFPPPPPNEIGDSDVAVILLTLTFLIGPWTQNSWPWQLTETDTKKYEVWSRKVAIWIQVRIIYIRRLFSQQISMYMQILPIANTDNQEITYIYTYLHTQSDRVKTKSGKSTDKYKCCCPLNQVSVTFPTFWPWHFQCQQSL